ncbi:MAG: radical SAM protein [Candidatus Bathyarchaeota archaeon]|nr:radical SAM protein [Candidatus Bathyarchaeota archaeon]
MSTVYGPVPSWRLGRSLGIDVLLPPKKCTFNCIYCQLGKTRVHVSGPEMLSETLVDADRVANDLDKVLRRLDLNTVDVVTFSGTGEPTLNLRLGKIAREVKKRIGSLPLAILTNSSLFHRKDVRKNLSLFDLIVAKLDAGDDETFRLINRPAHEKMSTETIVDSIKELRKVIKGAVALEVMLLRSEDVRVTNVEGESLRKLLDAILDVEPDQVQLEVPYRPPSESFVKPPPREKIELISDELSKALGEDKLWIYGLHDKRGISVNWLLHGSLEREVVELLKRRPCRLVDVSASLGIGLNTAQIILRRMKKRNILVSKMSEGEKYYSYRSMQ